MSFYRQAICKPPWARKYNPLWVTTINFHYWQLPGNGGPITRYYTDWIHTLWSELGCDIYQIETITGCRRWN